MNIINRKSWGARKPKGDPQPIDTPTPELWLHHTAGRESGAEGMRQIQAFHQDTRKWSDIAYSFVVDPVTLQVFEGRGAGIRGGHTRGHNSTSHAVCVMGNYETARVSPELVETLAQLVAHGYRSGWWTPGFTGGHRQASGASTTCPGKHLLDALPRVNERVEQLVFEEGEMVGVRLIRIDGAATVWVCNGVELQKVGSRAAFDAMGWDMKDVLDVSKGHPLAVLPRRDP